MLNNLMNDSQKRAIIHEKGPAIVLAGPGSGKTFVLTHRLIHLINQCSIDPNKILTITFTRAAAIEMRKRTISLHPEGNKIIFGTFHSIFYQILKTSEIYFNFSIIKESQKKQILKEILYLHPIMEEDFSFLTKQLLREISNIKTNGCDLNDYMSKSCPKSQFDTIFQEYEKALFQRKLLDFDDMVLLCYRYLRSDKDARAFWQNRFSYLLIDEFQDINKLQYDTILLLVNKHKNLFVVGDDDQAIYAFRGSNPAYMKKFMVDFSDAKQILLNTNYRSRHKIVQSAVKIIRNNKVRFPKNIKTGRLLEEEGEVILKECMDTKEEHTFIIEDLKKQLDDLSSIAVLCRTNNKVQAIAEKLFAEKIPFRLKERQANFYEHFIVKDILAYIRFAHVRQKRGEFYRFMNKPLRYISREAIRGEEVLFTELYSYYFGKKKIAADIKKLEIDISMLKSLDPYAAISYVLKGIGYERYVKQLAEGNLDKQREYEEMLQELLNRSKDFISCKEFLEFIEDYSINFEVAVPKNETPGIKNEVQLMTFHGSKGLEFKTVYLPYINGGIVPYNKAVTEEALEEERRMFYVAMTRAKDRLVLTCVNSETSKASVFWEELIAKKGKNGES